MKLRNKVVGISAAAAAFAAVAATIWPFVMKPYYPTMTYQQDSETFFQAAGNVPRLVMNTSVQNIKRGDTIRMVYPNGDVYDFEASAQCPAVAVCPLTNPVKKSSATDDANVSAIEVKDLRGDFCPWDSRVVEFDTGYWSDSWTEARPGQIVHSLKWVDTGPVSVYVKGTGCK